MKIDKRGRTLSDLALSNMGVGGRFIPKHGMKNTPEYRAWIDMKNRCRNLNVSSYPNYGGRGISVCQEWLDRIDCEGNYEPGNVRWVSSIKQQNNKRNNVFVLYRGEKITATEYARAVGIKPDTVHARIRRGAKLEGAVVCK